MVIGTNHLLEVAQSNRCSKQEVFKLAKRYYHIVSLIITRVKAGVNWLSPVGGRIGSCAQEHQSKRQMENLAYTNYTREFALDTWRCIESGLRSANYGMRISRPNFGAGFLPQRWTSWGKCQLRAGLYNAPESIHD